MIVENAIGACLVVGFIVYLCRAGARRSARHSCEVCENRRTPIEDDGVLQEMCSALESLLGCMVFLFDDCMSIVAFGRCAQGVVGPRFHRGHLIDIAPPDASACILEHLPSIRRYGRSMWNGRWKGRDVVFVSTLFASKGMVVMVVPRCLYEFWCDAVRRSVE